MLKQGPFFRNQHDYGKGLMVEEGLGCSFYSNVIDRNLNGDLTQLLKDLMMFTITLSLNESVEPDKLSFEED